MMLSHTLNGITRRSSKIVPSCDDLFQRNSIGKGSSDNKDLKKNIAMDGVKYLYGIAEKGLNSNDNVSGRKPHLGLRKDLDRYGVRIALSCGLSFLVGFRKPTLLKTTMSGRPCMGTPVEAAGKACRLSLPSGRVECGRHKRITATLELKGRSTTIHTNNTIRIRKNNSIVNHS